MNKVYCFGTYLVLLISCFSVQAASFSPVAVESVKNTLSSSCSIDTTVIQAGQTAHLTKPLVIPFVSIRNYLKEYTANRPYIPHQALTVKTARGRFCLWASEQGILCAPDYKQSSFFCDEWEPETLLEASKNDLSKRRFMVLVLKVLKDKLKLELEPAY